MSRRGALSCALLTCLCAETLVTAALYEVSGECGKVVGAWDANILSDNVHFEVPSLLREIRMPMAITGVQTCQLWGFEAMSRTPIHT